jgi:hypothetical protein
MNPDIIPKMDSITAKEKHLHHEANWKLFARRMQKNPFMRDFIINKTNKCARCRKVLSNFQLHHIDYDHYCQFSEPIKIHKPTKKRLNRHILVPDCASCIVKRPELFYECAKRVVPVHSYCNKLINDKMETYIKNDDESVQLSIFDDSNY